MSVKAVTTVSIVPSPASLRRSSTDSMPALPPGPPGRAASPLPFPPSAFTRRERSGTAGRLYQTGASIGRDLVFLQGPHRTLIVVRGRDQVPDPEEQGQEDREWRVVDEARVEVGVPRQARRRVGQVERIHN